MLRSTFIACLAVFLGTISAWAQTTQPETKIDPKIESILDRVEKRGETIKSLTADMDYKRVQTLIEETATRGGKVSYLIKTEANPDWDKLPEKMKAEHPEIKSRERVYFRVQFDWLITAGFKSTKKETYVFDGKWLHELNEKNKQLVHREIVDEDQPLNPMRLGEGPFPAPFAQKKKDVVDAFSLKLVAPAKDDPADSDHLELTPKAGTDLARTYTKIDLLVSRKLDIPVRMVTMNTSQEEITVDFKNIKINPELEVKDFQIERPSNYEELYQRLGATPDKRREKP